MRSVWLCTRNDALGNVAVMLAALGVFGIGSAWPDLAVATVMAGLAIIGGWSVVRQTRGELKQASSQHHKQVQTGVAAEKRLTEIDLPAAHGGFTPVN